MDIKFYFYASEAYKFTDRKTGEKTIAVELPNSHDVIVVSQDPSGEVADDVLTRKDFEKDYKPNKENMYFIYKLASTENPRDVVFVFKLPFTKRYVVILQDYTGEYDLEYYKESKLIKDYPLITKHHISKLNNGR